MSKESEFYEVYEQYAREYLNPITQALSDLRDEWASDRFWAPAKSASDPIIPTPVYRIRSRIKRPGSAWDKLVRQGKDNQKIDYDLLNTFDDLLGVRVVMFLSNSYPVIHAAIGRSSVIELHPNHKPKCYLPRATIDRLGMESSSMDIPDVKPSGYGSIHYTVRFKDSASYKIPRFELQVRTILLEAWGEIEHKLNYKSSEQNELSVRRQLRVIADTLRAVDEHFEIVDERARYLRQLHGEIVQGDDSAVLDDGTLARLLSQHEIPVSESELGKLRRILSAHRMNTVGQFKARATQAVLSWIREGVRSAPSPRMVDASTVVAIVVTLPLNATKEEVLNAVRTRLSESSISRESTNRLFEPYKKND